MFSDLQTDGSGNITATYASPNFFAMNAIVLVATAGSGPDTTPPAIVFPTNPADNATGVLVNADLVATFDENIALTGAGTVTIRDRDSLDQVRVASDQIVGWIRERLV